MIKKDYIYIEDETKRRDSRDYVWMYIHVQDIYIGTVVFRIAYQPHRTYYAYVRVEENLFGGYYSLDDDDLVLLAMDYLKDKGYDVQMM